MVDPNTLAERRLLRDQSESTADLLALVAEEIRDMTTGLHTIPRLELQLVYPVDRWRTLEQALQFAVRVLRAGAEVLESPEDPR